MFYCLSKKTFKNSNDIYSLVIRIISTEYKRLITTDFIYRSDKKNPFEKKKKKFKYSNYRLKSEMKKAKLLLKKVSENISITKIIFEIPLKKYFFIKQTSHINYEQKFQAFILILIFLSNNIVNFFFENKLFLGKNLSSKRFSLKNNITKRIKFFFDYVFFQIFFITSEKFKKNLLESLNENKLSFLKTKKISLIDNSKETSFFSTKISFPLYRILKLSFYLNRTIFKVALYSKSNDLFVPLKNYQKKKRNQRKIFQLENKLKFYFFYWKLKWDSEIYFFNRTFKTSNWISNKTWYLNKNVFFTLKSIKEKNLKFHEISTFNFIVSKIKFLVQKFPNAFILKARLLCKILVKNNSNEKKSLVRIWVNDIQGFFHANLLNFLILYIDIVFLAPKINNLFSASFLFKNKIFIPEDLFKIPQDLEKILEFKQFKSKPFSKKFSIIVYRCGLFDFYRKYLLKMIFSSDLIDQKTLLSYLLNFELKILSLSFLTKNPRSKILFEKKFIGIKEIFKILELNGQWALIYVILCENIHVFGNLQPSFF